MSSQRKAIVTGATGFVGHHLATTLIARGWEVTIIVRSGSPNARIPTGSNVEVHDGSTRQMIEIFKRNSPEVVFHLASMVLTGHTVDQVDLLVESNLRFGLQLLEAASHAGCTRFINTGTGWQHFENKDYDPVCLYAATKQAFENLIQFYVNVSGMKVVTLKLHDNYGKKDPRRKLMVLLLNAARTGEMVDLSPGEQRIDLLNVKDVSEAYIIADEVIRSKDLPSHEHYMIKAESTISVRELVAMIRQVTGQELNVRWGARPYRDREVMLPSDRGEPLPGWKQTMSLEEGIGEIWAEMS
jgi:nucleoside-diphosphate-sugar epimerase